MISFFLFVYLWMTIKELQERQSWTLDQKIDHAVGAIEAFISRTGKIPYISFSGGKDSTVLLDLARRFVSRDIKAVFCNTGNEFPEIIKFVRRTENVHIIRPDRTVKKILDKYGFPLVSKEQSLYINQARHTKSAKLLNTRLYGCSTYKIGKISERWKYLINARFEVSPKCCFYLKKKPFHIYERKTGELPILGIMAEESELRKSSYIRRGGCNSFTGKIASHPISIFLERDIWEYKRKFKIDFCPLYDIPGVKRIGCMFCGFGAHKEKDFSRFELLYNLHPKAYKSFMEYKNNGVTYREALRAIGILLPDEIRQLRLFNDADFLLPDETKTWSAQN